MGKALDQKMFRLAKRRWEHAREYWRPKNDMYGRLLAFCLDLEHYRTEEGFSKDKRRVQPRTQRQLNLIRHKASLLLRNMPTFTGHAVQPGASGKAAEISRRIIENVFLDPLKGYHDTRSRFVWSALAGGRGNVAIDWHPIYGVVTRFVDPRRVHITPGHTFMHSPLTPTVTEEVPMRQSELARMKDAGWRIPANLAPDDWKPDYATGGQRDDSLVDFHSGQSANLPGADESEESDRIVTVIKTWYRHDPFASDRKVEAEADLSIDEWHFVDDALGIKVPFDPENPVPPMSEATGQPLRLVTKRSDMYDSTRGEDGYLCIVAPFGQVDKPLFEGKWLEGSMSPDATLPSFPYMEMGCYTHPLRRQGISDTEATRTLVVVDNSSQRQAFEQTKQTGGILVTEAGALLDSEGNQFQFSDDPISIAYAKDRLSLDGVNFFQAPGMNATMPAFRNMVEQSWVHIGTGDMALGPDRSRDIAASTVQQLQQQGDLPVQLHQQDLNLQESIGGAVALAYCMAYMGDNAVSWVSDSGEVAYATVRGTDLVPLKVTVTAGNEWQQKDIDRVQAQAQFLGMVGKMGLPPQVIAVLLREAQFSDSVVEALSQAMAPPPPPGGDSGAPVPGGNLPPNGPVEGQAQ